MKKTGKEVKNSLKVSDGKKKGKKTDKRGLIAVGHTKTAELNNYRCFGTL